MMLRTIQTAQPLPRNCIKLVWGSASVVDLKPVLAKGGVFAFLRDPAAFDAVAVGARGRTLHALVAAMQKLLTILNAMLRDGQAWRVSQSVLRSQDSP
jgi:hypothetical protein